MFQVPEKFRVIGGAFGTTAAAGNNGHFNVMIKQKRGSKRKFTVIASDGAEWEHVSVSLPDRCPTWAEMDYIKDLFWGSDQFVVQYHPPKKEQINNHQYCLHLWRPVHEVLPHPPAILVGVK